MNPILSLRKSKYAGGASTQEQVYRSRREKKSSAWGSNPTLITSQHSCVFVLLCALENRIAPNVSICGVPYVHYYYYYYFVCPPTIEDRPNESHIQLLCILPQSQLILKSPRVSFVLSSSIIEIATTLQILIFLLMLSYMRKISKIQSIFYFFNILLFKPFFDVFA